MFHIKKRGNITIKAYRVTGNHKPSDFPEKIGIDINKAICPNCDENLKNPPSRKTRCPHCGINFYVRTRPVDGVRVAVTEKDAERIDIQWMKINGTYEHYLQVKREKDGVRKKLHEQFGHAPSDDDMEWAYLNIQLIQHAQAGQMGLYRNDRLHQGKILRKRKKIDQALETYLEVCYLDLNGANNSSRNPWRIEYARLAPGIIGTINDIIEQKELQESEVHNIFHSHNNPLEKELGLPVNPDAAWNQLAGELTFVKEKLA